MLTLCIASVDDGVLVLDILHNPADEPIGALGGRVDGDELEGAEWLRHCACCIWTRLGMFAWLKGLMCYTVKSDRQERVGETTSPSTGKDMPSFRGRNGTIQTPYYYLIRD